MPKRRAVILAVTVERVVQAGAARPFRLSESTVPRWFAWYRASVSQRSSPPTSWEVPGGKQDWLVGTGATRAERTLMWAASLGGVALYGWAWATDQYQWRWWQYLLAMVVAADLFGGAVANATNSAKRQYFGPLSPDAVARVRSAPIARLHAWCDRVLDARDLDGVFAD